MARKLDGKVTVITGASSGIGRATARLFAAQGATVVLAARRETVLHEVATDVIDAGGRAMSVPTDVRDPDQVQHLAQRAIEAFGGIDIWINNAGLGSFGKFEETPSDAFDAVIATTFYGVVNGFRAVLPHFRSRRRGTIITTASVAGRVPTPFQSPYNAAKHAVLGFVETVRQELILDRLDDVHVCSVLPGPIDTPFWQHSANFTGREIKALSPARAPEEVADAILDLVIHPRREVGVGAPPWLTELGMALAQGPTERRLARQTASGLFGEGTEPRSHNALLRPIPAGTGVYGGWRERQQRESRGNGTKALAGVLALTLPIGLAALYRYQRDRRVF
jgi:NAD(P)-dependent dehydrogenase (short-subunit alcohol dehydrogenase family)